MRLHKDRKAELHTYLKKTVTNIFFKLSNNSLKNAAFSTSITSPSPVPAQKVIGVKLGCDKNSFLCGCGS